MAADWIKIEHSLPGKPEVMEIARLLDIDEMAVVGHLVCFWVWVDQNLSPECPAVKGTKRGLDRVAGRDKFVDALISVGWLAFDGESFTIPNYEHHLSESAKKRAVEARKKQNHRSRPPKCPADKGTKQGTKQGTERGTREEKRREESIKESMREIPVHSEDIRIPQNVDNQNCRMLMDQLFAAMNQRRRESGEYNLDDFAIQANWDIAGQIGPDDLATIVPKAIANNWKSLTALGASGVVASKVASKGRRRSNEFTVDQEAEWVKITAACRMTGEKGDRARSALGPETCRIMTQIGGSQAIRDTKPGDFQETELKKRFFATRESERALQTEGVPA